MNRIEFYNKLDRYKQVHLDNEELQHSASNYGKQYYNKIDKYYPDGTARYFYSQAEWEAYQREKDQDKWRKQQEAKKKAEEKNNMSGYDTWKKNQTAQEEAKKSQANKLNDISDEKKQKQAEVYNKNAEAAANEGNREEYRREREAEWGRRKAIYRKEQQAAIDAKNIRRNSAADAHEGDREQAKIEAQKRYDDAERAKYQGKKKLEEKQEAERKQKELDEVKRLGKENMEKAEQERKWKRQQEEAQRRVEQREQAKQQAQYMNNVEAIKRAEEEKKHAETKAKGDAILAEKKKAEEALTEYKNNSIKELTEENTKLVNDITKAYLGDSDSIDTSNKLYKYLDAELRKIDPDYAKYKKSLYDYIKPGVFGYEAKRMKKVETALENMKANLTQEGSNKSYTDIKESGAKTLLEDKAKEETRKINNGITAELGNARISLGKMYNGDSKTFKLDDSLKKELDKKLKEIDEDYEGDIYKYVRPYLFGTWIKDSDSYDNVKKALDQLELELRNSDEMDDVYGDFIKELTKI